MGIVIEKERVHYASPNCCVASSFVVEGGFSRSAVKDTLRRVIARHEILSCVVTQDKNGAASYERAQVKTPVKFEDASPTDDWTDIVEREERIPFRLEAESMLRVFVRMDKDRARFVFVAHHLAGDALSHAFLAKDVCRALAEPTLTLPALPVRLFDGGTVPRSARLPFFLSMAARGVNKRWRKTGKVFSAEDRLGLFDRYWDRYAMRVSTAEIDGERMLSLLSRCHEHGVTVNSAVVAAILAEYDGERSVGVTVSLRPKECEGMANFATGISVKCTYNHLLGFWDNAHALHTAIRGQLTDEKKLYFLHNFMACVDPTLIDAASYAAYADYANPVAARARDMFGYGTGKSIAVTNLTRLPIPTDYGALRLSSFAIVPPLPPNASVMVGVATAGMRMTLSLVCARGDDEAKHMSAFDCAVLRLSTIKS